MNEQERICRAFDVNPILVLGDHRSRRRKLWDRMPWSWYARAVRRWRKEYGV